MTVHGYCGRAWRFLRTLHQEFTEDNGAMVSAAMSFYAVLSVVPLLIMAVAGLGYFLGADQAFANVFDRVGQLSPAFAKEKGTAIRDLLEGVVKGKSAAGGLGLLVLLWSGSQTFVSLEMAVNIAWAVKKRRGFIRQRLLAIAMVFVGGLLLLVSFGLTTLARNIQRIKVPVVELALSDLHWLWSLVAVLLPLLITITTFALVFKFLPNRPVRLRHAAVGAVVSGVLWELAKHIFSWYVPRFANYNAVYGSLGTMIILMVWIYYSSMVAVIGAEVAAITARAKKRD